MEKYINYIRPPYIRSGKSERGDGTQTARQQRLEKLRERYEYEMSVLRAEKWREKG